MILVRTFAVALLACVLGGAADARTVLTGPTTFYVGGGTDVAGCGAASGSPCATREYFWNQLVATYDLACQQVRIQVGTPGTRTVYTDGFYGQGTPPGLCTRFQMTPGVALAQTLQIIWIGDTSNPLNSVIRPAAGAGPAFFPENGAFYAIEGFTIDGVNSPWTDNSMVGATDGSGLAIAGPVIFGCAPKMVEVQPGVRSSFWVFSSYTIDHTQCGDSNSFVAMNAAVINGSNQLGMGQNIPGVTVGMHILDEHGCVPDAATVTAVSYSTFYVTMSVAATCSQGLEGAQFSTNHMGRPYFHVQQDSYSYAFYETDMSPVPHITVTLSNTPAYVASFLANDNANTMLNPSNAAAVTFKGSIWGSAATCINNCLIFNNPNNQTVVFTP